jgi:hypothetical protein
MLRFRKSPSTVFGYRCKHAWSLGWRHEIICHIHSLYEPGAWIERLILGLLHSSYGVGLIEPLLLCGRKERNIQRFALRSLESCGSCLVIRCMCVGFRLECTYD